MSLNDETTLNEESEVVRGAAGMPEVPPPNPAGDLADVDDLEEAMRDVVDPELGINVVDLGLAYDIRVDEGNVATLDMTLTSAACPLTDVIADQTPAALPGGPGGGLVDDVRINWVWIPPWGPATSTDDRREQVPALVQRQRAAVVGHELGGVDRNGLVAARLAIRVVAHAGTEIVPGGSGQAGLGDGRRLREPRRCHQCDHAGGEDYLHGRAWGQLPFRRGREISARFTGVG